MHRAYEISSALQAMMGEDGQRSGGGGHGIGGDTKLSDQSELRVCALSD